MGFISDAELRRTPQDPNAPQKTGSHKAEFRGANVTATLTIPHTCQHGPELPITVTPHVWHEPLILDAGRVLFWSGIAVAVDIAALNSALHVEKRARGDLYLVVASLATPETPESPLGWFACAPLRPKIKGTTLENDTALKTSLENGTQFRDLPRDPFLTAKGTLVARLNDPLRLHYENGRNLGNGFVVGPSAPATSHLVWHFGICSRSCLKKQGLDWTASPPAHSQPVRPTAAIRVPHSEIDPAHAKIWHRLAGRARAPKT